MLDVGPQTMESLLQLQRLLPFEGAVGYVKLQTLLQIAWAEGWMLLWIEVFLIVQATEGL